jgi:ketosteroid isomerase-like protein
MSRERNLQIAQNLLAGVGQGVDPDDIATLFSGDVRFDIAGDVGALPWIGHKTGRTAASDFFRDIRRLTQSIRFDVEATLADDSRAVILGALASSVHATGRIIETAFALILTIDNLEITRFQMLEDSFAVSRAARP